MSYDLFLFPRGKRTPLTREGFHAYFDGDRFTHDGDEVHYSNDATGVYFHFAYSDGAGEDDDPNRKPKAHIVFNMNVFRPHYFALEAEPVVRRLVDHFGLRVSDPQTEGMGKDPFSSEGFLRGWNAGNRFAARAFSQLQATEEVVPLHHTLPTAVNRAVWGWTYLRDELADDLADEEIDVYLPPVWFCDEAGQVRTFCLSPNPVPNAVPRVDYVMILRDELPSPHKSKSRKTPAWARWEDMRAAAASFEVREEGDPETLPYLLLYASDGYVSPETAPLELARRVIALPGWPGKPQTLPADQVLDAELFTDQAGGDLS